MSTSSRCQPQHILSDDEWLQEWTSLSSKGRVTPIVPHPACLIHTPLLLSRWKEALEGHPNQPLVQFFLNGVAEGFRIGHNCGAVQLKSAQKNLDNALQHKEVVSEYLQSEVDNMRVAGPFTRAEAAGAQVSRFGVIPKNRQPNKWRLIVDLSHPRGHSVNDGIPKHLCSLSYISVDDAIDHILLTEPNTLLAKIDIKNAFRLLPVHPADRHLLAMEWEDRIYFDTCLPFGLRSAPKLFNMLAEMLTWIVKQNGVTLSIHYLDDFLTMGPPDSPICHHNLQTFIHTCDKLGVPLALEKVEGPTTCLTFLGITLDTGRMEIRLPDEKLLRIRKEVLRWLPKRTATKREILSLVGLLQHATKVIRCGRTFVGRMYQAATKVKQLSFYTRLTKEFRSDLYWWHFFLASWNGLSLLRSSKPGQTDCCIQTDASGSWGCGALFGLQWLQWCWSAEWSTMDIMVKELAPIVISCAVYGPQLRRQQVLFQCDNQSLVVAINKGYSKEPSVMRLLWCLWFFVAIFDISITAEHIPGTTNCAADMLSRNAMTNFFSLFSQVHRLPTPIPAPLLDIIAPNGPDWTSPIFSSLFSDILQMVQPRAHGAPTPQASNAI